MTPPTTAERAIFHYENNPLARAFAMTLAKVLGLDPVYGYVVAVLGSPVLLDLLDAGLEKQKKLLAEQQSPVSKIIIPS